MSIKIYQVDAFANEPFTGNPACVCLMEDERPDAWLQSVAAEMNLSETAFVWRKPDGFHIRWFTPWTEVELCGHATLGSAHVLWESGWLESSTEAKFNSLSGVLGAVKEGDDIFLDFPAKAPVSVEPPSGLLEGLNVEPLYVGTDKTDFVIEVGDEATICELSPDFEKLKNVEARGIIVTSASESNDYDFVSRFFGPAVGINEDPVTGSAHCILAPYWSKKLEKQSMLAYQASARGGFLSLEVNDSRVRLGGKAKTVFAGELLV